MEVPFHHGAETFRTGSPAHRRAMVCYAFGNTESSPGGRTNERQFFDIAEGSAVNVLDEW